MTMDSKSIFRLLAFMDKLVPLIKTDGYLIANFKTKFDDLYSSGEDLLFYRFK